MSSGRSKGPLAQVKGLRPETLTYQGAAQHLQDAWIAVRASLRAVLEHITIDQLVKGELPPEIAHLVADPDAWVARRLLLTGQWRTLGGPLRAPAGLDRT